MTGTSALVRRVPRVRRQTVTTDEGVDYAICPREGEDGAGEFAGACGLGVARDRRLSGLGLGLRRRFWGQGYSGERDRTLAALAFDALDLEVLGVPHDLEDEKSRRAVEALEGRTEGRIRNDTVIDGEPRDWVP